MTTQNVVDMYQNNQAVRRFNESFNLRILQNFAAIF